MISEGSDLPSGVDPAYPYTDAGERSAVLRAQRGLLVFLQPSGWFKGVCPCLVEEGGPGGTE